MIRAETMTRDDGFFAVPKWNEEVSSLDAFEERIKLYATGAQKEERYLCGPRFLAMDSGNSQKKHPTGGHNSTGHRGREGLIWWFLHIVNFVPYTRHFEPFDS